MEKVLRNYKNKERHLTQNRHTLDQKRTAAKNRKNGKQRLFRQFICFCCYHPAFCMDRITYNLRFYLFL